MNISNINTYNSDLLLKIRLICEGKKLQFKSIEYIPFMVKVLFGLPNFTFLLPNVLDSFYYIPALGLVDFSTGHTGIPLIRLQSNTGQGSIGDIDIALQPVNDLRIYPVMVTNIIQYQVGTHSAGSFILMGDVYKISAI